MSRLYPVITVLRPAFTSRRSPRTVWRPADREDRGFFSGVRGWQGLTGYEPEGPEDWGNKVLSEADFTTSLNL